MDDVVADWMEGARRCLHAHNMEKDTHGRIPHASWEFLALQDRFYLDLPLLPGAHELVAWAREYAEKNNMFLAFLTAIPHNNDMPYVFHDKTQWADKHFPGIPVFFGPYSTDKQVHCKPGDILIDDRFDNCASWTAVGGLAHQYTTWEKCKHWIVANLDPSLVKIYVPGQTS